MTLSSIHPTAVLGEGTTVGEACVVGENVRVGTGCRIGHGVVLHADTRIGNQVRIDDHSSLGKRPMRAANSAVTRDQELPPLALGDLGIVGSGVVLYRGASIAEKVLLADLCTVREQVTIGRGTIVGRGVTIENACTIGRYCKLESECYITAYSTLEDRVFIAPGVVTSNDNFVGRTAERFKHFKGVTVRRGGRVGAGAVLLPGVTVGEDGLVAAWSDRARSKGWDVSLKILGPHFDELDRKLLASELATYLLVTVPESTMSVPLLDLRAQYADIKAELDQAVHRVLESTRFIGGPEVAGLEEEVARYCRSAHAIGCASGTDALLLALRVLDIGPGDEVVTSAFSFFASAGTIANVGARPVFVDIDPRAFNLDPHRLEAAITPATKAVMPVHLFGQCCDLTAVQAVCDKHQLWLIEDAAQAIGSE